MVTALNVWFIICLSLFTCGLAMTALLLLLVLLGSSVLRGLFHTYELPRRGKSCGASTCKKKAKQLPGISIALLELEFDCALIALDKEAFVGLAAGSLAQETVFADVSFLSDNSQAEVHIPGSH